MLQFAYLILMISFILVWFVRWFLWAQLHVALVSDYFYLED